MGIERRVKQIVITMTVDQNTDIPNHGIAKMMRTLGTELEVNDVGANEIPKECFKENSLTDGKIEKDIFNLIKPYFENMTGVPISEESHRE